MTLILKHQFTLTVYNYIFSFIKMEIKTKMHYNEN